MGSFRFDITDAKGNVYMRRYRLVQTRWFNVYVHQFFGPDPDRDLHDHPWSFVSFILKGNYLEELPSRGMVPTSFVFRPRFSIIRHKATDRHRIASVERGTWTLVLTGPKVREWGFWVRGVWEHWRSYLDRKFAGQDWTSV